MHESLVTLAQLRAGRALLGLFQAKLAGRTCLPLTTIQLAEAEGSTWRVRSRHGGHASRSGGPWCDLP